MTPAKQKEMTPTAINCSPNLSLRKHKITRTCHSLPREVWPEIPSQEPDAWSEGVAADKTPPCRALPRPTAPPLRGLGPSGQVPVPHLPQE